MSSKGSGSKKVMVPVMLLLTNLNEEAWLFDQMISRGQCQLKVMSIKDSEMLLIVFSLRVSMNSLKLFSRDSMA
jgi:hypothetical protein